MKDKIYQFQCMKCYIVSGHISRNSEDAPTCCCGEPMVATEIINNKREIRREVKG